MENKFNKKVVVNLPIEPDVKEILDEHGNRLCKHDSEIKDLQMQNIETKALLNNIKEKQEDYRNENKSDIKEIKGILLNQNNSLLNSNNALLNSMNNLIINKADNETKKSIAIGENDTQKLIAIETNRKDIIIKVLWIVGSLAVGLLAGGHFLS